MLFRSIGLGVVHRQPERVIGGHDPWDAVVWMSHVAPCARDRAGRTLDSSPGQRKLCRITGDAAVDDFLAPGPHFPHFPIVDHESKPKVSLFWVDGNEIEGADLVGSLSVSSASATATMTAATPRRVKVAIAIPSPRDRAPMRIQNDSSRWATYGGRAVTGQSASSQPLPMTDVHRYSASL